MDTITPSPHSPRLPTSSASSPEFEFLLLGNTSTAALLTADELFLDGVLLPLHHLSLDPNPPDLNSPPPPPPHHQEQPPDTDAPLPPPPPPPPQTQHPKKWMDLFKVSEKSLEELRARRLRQARDSTGSAAELNINIWPFSRSRSTGTNSNSRARSTSSNIIVGHRKASSAPCSRSNSRGDSTKQTTTPSSTAMPLTSATTVTTTTVAKKWMPSSGRVAGIHIGRANPVWKRRRKINVPQIKDNKAENSDGMANARKCSASGGGNASARVLNFNVNTCIGYGNQVSCSVDHVSKMSSGGAVGAAAGGGAGGRAEGEGEGESEGGGHECQSGNNRGLFILRAIFSKKVY